MTLPVRRFAMTIAVLLMMHVIGMAVDPHGMHADAATGPSLSHAMTTNHDHHHDHGPSGRGMAAPDQSHGLTDLSAWTCMDTEGVAPQSRVPLEPEAFAAVLPAPVGSDLRPWTEPWREWDPPTPEAGELRIFLQVFLN